jgi:glycosyltransferase involved in cell wall biosynthesis
MKICFILGSTVFSGGTYVIFEHAIRINRRGNKDVFMVMQNRLKPEDLFWHPEARELQWMTFEEAKEIEFDAVIATWWGTCYDAYRLKSKAYLYFTQSIESKFYPPQNKFERNYADSTYFFGFNVITEATWIKNYLKGNYNLDAEVVLNGIRKDFYKSDGPVFSQREKSKLRVLVEGPLGVFFKNVENTIKICKQSKADEVWLLTSTETKNYPGVDRLISKVPIFKTAEVYRSCDVLVKLSYVEGMFGPPLEMFHCGGTAIVYDVTGHDEYIRHGYNSLVVKTNDEKKVIDLIDYLKANPHELERLKLGAKETAEKWNDWDFSSKKFEEAVEISIQKKKINQKQLIAITNHFKKWREVLRREITFEYLIKVLFKFVIKGLLNNWKRNLFHNKHVR